MLHVLERMVLRYGVLVSTTVMVVIAIFTATLFDYIYYTILFQVEMYDGWFYSDLFIATAVGFPVIGILFRLIEKGYRQQAALNDALSQVKELKAWLPMCACCKKIRDDEDQWHHPDVYIRDHTNSKVSHGICPQCQQDDELSEFVRRQGSR